MIVKAETNQTSAELPQPQEHSTRGSQAESSPVTVEKQLQNSISRIEQTDQAAEQIQQDNGRIAQIEQHLADLESALANIGTQVQQSNERVQELIGQTVHNLSRHWISEDELLAAYQGVAEQLLEKYGLTDLIEQQESMKKIIHLIETFQEKPGLDKGAQRVLSSNVRHLRDSASESFLFEPPEFTHQQHSEDLLRTLTTSIIDNRSDMCSPPSYSESLNATYQKALLEYGQRLRNIDVRDSRGKTESLLDSMLEHFRALLDSKKPWEAQESFRREVWTPMLQIRGLEEMPVAPGETKADPPQHEISSSKPSEYPEGTVAKVILPGVRNANGKQVKLKAVVIRADRP